MSDISAKHLITTNKGVHKQFDLLVSAMLVLSVANSDANRDELMRISPKERERWLKEQLEIAMTQLGHRPGFLMRRLALYVFQLYEHFYSRFTYAMSFKAGTAIADIQKAALPLAANFLDSQFEREGTADICLFLKQDPRLLKRAPQR